MQRPVDDDTTKIHISSYSSSVSRGSKGFPGKMRSDLLLVPLPECRALEGLAETGSPCSTSGKTKYASIRFGNRGACPAAVFLPPFMVRMPCTNSKKIRRIRKPIEYPHRCILSRNRCVGRREIPCVGKQGLPRWGRSPMRDCTRGLWGLCPHT